MAISRFLLFSLIPILALSAPQAPARRQSSPQSTSKPFVSKVWVADQGNGTYRNPILYADYSDPDVIRVGDDFYLTASSFNCVPGLPVLHSKDLVNWELIGHVYAAQAPLDAFSKPQHGNGAWAPSIRYHNGEFYIFYPDPDYGIYMVKAKNPAGPWSKPLLIKEAKGWIDPSPLWDDDGRAYLVNAMAASRSGIKSTLIVSRMSPDGTRLLDDGVIVFDGHAKDPTVEGPKFYKRNGYYYIAAPAGGVPTGWQLVLRSRHVYGPYERRVVLAQGHTATNGPHQGGWVDTPSGEFWFIHFQDQGPYGRVTLLEPMKWVNDWPVIGVHQNDEGTGEPVSTYRKPNVGRAYPIATPVDSDEFNSDGLGPQWQWSANPQPNWMFPSGSLGFLRLICVLLPQDFTNFWDLPNLLLQKFPAPEFTATTKITFAPMANNDETGLLVMGADYSYLAVKKTAEGLAVSQVICRNADRKGTEKESALVPVKAGSLYLRVQVTTGAVCHFSFSTDGATFSPVGQDFTAKPGRWIGAKVGLFAVRTGTSNEAGYADFDWFRFE
ncbi:MAG TPA: glycoside hydrolase 43 family protein [Bryobacteraceae bacterium]|nr:glycoside hydrolase 43 family protein [Bryobacteraceae bacterium]